MTELKITIDQLKNYLGTGLKMGMKDHKIDYVGREIDTMIGLHQWDKSGQLWCIFTEGGSKPAPSQVQPICYRLSDLDKFIPELEFVPIDELNKDFGYDQVRLVKYSNSGVGWNIDSCFSNTAISWIDMYPVIQKLFQWNFWPFGEEYFNEGLVVDKLKI